MANSIKYAIVLLKKNGHNRYQSRLMLDKNHFEMKSMIRLVFKSSMEYKISERMAKQIAMHESLWFFKKLIDKDFAKMKALEKVEQTNLDTEKMFYQAINFALKSYKEYKDTEVFDKNVEYLLELLEKNVVYDGLDEYGLFGYFIDEVNSLDSNDLVFLQKFMENQIIEQQI